MTMVRQRSFDDLGTHLAETTFCVLDLETTGGAPGASRITEIGAVKVRGGEVLGELQTLVNPGEPIPRFVQLLTGITDHMVAGAPPIQAALPALLEFLGDAVVVAHNASFDTRFLQAEAAALGYPRLDNPVVCTVRLARRLVRDEVRNLKLSTLANAMGARTRPDHRALNDARATADVFHSLLELAGRWGVSHLDDLLWFQGAGGHPQRGKLAVAGDLPRCRGVYIFRGATGEPLYIGKATNLRDRVRSYFSADDRRRIGDMLREMQTVDHIVCDSDLEASVLEARLIRAHVPAYNRAGRGRRAGVYLTLTAERFPRLSVARSDRGGAVLGPVARGTAEAVREALEIAGGIRTCSARIGPKTRFPACVLAEMGRCAAPCEGRVGPEEYAASLAPVREALGGDPTATVASLARRIDRLSGLRRFEEAAQTRDRIGALVEAARRARADRALRAAGRLRVRIGPAVVEIEDGMLVAAGGREPPAPADGHPDEPRLIAAWLARNRARIRIEHADGELAFPLAGGRMLEEWRVRLSRREARPA